MDFQLYRGTGSSVEGKGRQHQCEALEQGKRVFKVLVYINSEEIGLWFPGGQQKRMLSPTVWSIGNAIIVISLRLNNKKADEY